MNVQLDNLITVLKQYVDSITNLLSIINKFKTVKINSSLESSCSLNSNKDSKENKDIKNIILSKFRKLILQLSTRLDTVRLILSKEDFESLLDTINCSWDYETSRVTIKDGPVAQRSEQETHNLLAGGSNPSGPTK